MIYHNPNWDDPDGDGSMGGLPSEADNYDVWCERCQRVHSHFTFTQEKFDGIVKAAAHKIAEAVDAEALASVLAEMSKKDKP